MVTLQEFLIIDPALSHPAASFHGLKQCSKIEEIKNKSQMLKHISSALKSNIATCFKIGDRHIHHISQYVNNLLPNNLILVCKKANTGCRKNDVITVHNGVKEITVNVRKMLKHFYWTYLLIWRSLEVALNSSIISKYMY
jgi:hypothetical protein